MTPRVTTDFAKNYCNRTLTVKVIVENVFTCFLGTQCSKVSAVSCLSLYSPNLLLKRSKIMCYFRLILASIGVQTLLLKLLT